MSTGFEIYNQQLWIEKDPEAQLVYTFDWSQWLQAGDELSQVEYTIQARLNDPSPLTQVASGLVLGTKTYIELSGGQVEKNYVVTAKITTTNGLIDRRNFRVKIINRSA